MARQLQLPIQTKNLSRQFEPVPHVAAGAKRFAAQQGREVSHEGLGDIQANPTITRNVANVYMQGQQHAPSGPLLKSYEAMRHEVGQQYQHMVKPAGEGGMGMQVHYTEHDPYETPQAMAADVQQGRISVYKTGEGQGHPFFSNENNQFRAVHDVFGHAAIGRGFSRHGEEAAYQAHAQMFSPAARPALASETRGNSYLINQGNFPENRPVDMPGWATSATSPRLPKQGRKVRRSGERQLSLF